MENETIDFFTQPCWKSNENEVYEKITVKYPMTIIAEIAFIEEEKDACRYFIDTKINGRCVASTRAFLTNVRVYDDGAIYVFGDHFSLNKKLLPTEKDFIAYIENNKDKVSRWLFKEAQYRNRVNVSNANYMLKRQLVL